MVCCNETVTWNRSRSRHSTPRRKTGSAKRRGDPIYGILEGMEIIDGAIDDAVQLRVTRCRFAEKRRGHDAAVVQRVGWVFEVRDGVVDQSLLVVDPRKLGKAHHRVGVFVPLRTRVRTREERVDPG